MSEHALKTWPEYWAAIESGAKTFEVRRDDDRSFQTGDILSLREWSPLHERFTGREVKRWVTYVLRDAEKFGVREGFVVLGLTSVPPIFAPDGHRYVNGAGRCECGAPGNPLRMWVDHVKDVTAGDWRDDAIQTAGHVWHEEMENEGGASADYAASAGAQVAREQATDLAESTVADIARQEAARVCEGLPDVWIGYDTPEVRSLIHLAAERTAHHLAVPTSTAVERGAEAISDLLTMLGVTPDERPEHGGPTTAEVLAAAVLGVRHSPVEVPNA